MLNDQGQSPKRCARSGIQRRQPAGLWRFALSLLLVCSTTLWAAEAEPKADAEDSTSGEQSSAASAAADADADEPKFKPTEEISEDFAVSFPVDI